MKISTRGRKWEIVTHIHKTVGEKEFLYSELGPEMVGQQGYFKDLLFAGMVVRIRRKSYGSPSLYKLPQNMLDMIRRHTE